MTTRDEALETLTAPGQPFEIVAREAIGRQVRVFRNAPASVRDLFEASRSEKTFLVFGAERLTYEEVWGRACTLAHVLVDRFGVRQGDRVAIAMRNYPEWIISYAAIASIGAVAVAINALWTADEIAYGLAMSEPKVLIADQERLDRLAPLGPPPPGLAIVAVRTAFSPFPQAIPWSDLLLMEERSDMPPAVISPDDDLQMLFTSGSTGSPKGAVSTHRNVVTALLSWELDVHAGWETGLLQRPSTDPPPPQTAMLLAIPLFHVTGLLACCLQCCRYQRRLVLMYKWDVEQAADIIEREGVTHFTATPAITGDLVAFSRLTGRTFPTLVALGGGGAARAPEQVRAIAAVFAQAKPGTGWGMTETNAIGTGISADDYQQRPGSSGRVSAVLDIRIVDANGDKLPPGVSGELQVRGASVISGYHERPEANLEAFTSDGWFRTGDVAYIDDAGFLFIVDRIKDLVIRGGENIGCGAVESALQEHPSVVEACVYGVPDARLGEEVAATIYAGSPVTEAELREFLATRLGKFQIPRYFHFAQDPLPRGATGKIMKKDLRSEAARRLTTGAS